MKRENFYTLLGLQVEPPEKDKDTIERAIVEKREQWFDILWNAPHSKAQKVRVYLDMLPEIKRIMRDENTRREEARQAKDMNRKKEMERFKQLDEIINIIGLDGTISPEESDFVICKAVAMGLKPEDTETYLKTYCFKKDWKYHPEKSLHSQERKNRNTGTGRKKKFFNNSWALVVGINNYEQKRTYRKNRMDY
ncbi:MAG: hypothetical protein GY757_00230, partial [bacterium]|nr:hypothetical protein [bacterium]